MGKPLPSAANPASGKPPAGDSATEVVSGAFTGLGQTSAPFCFYGPFNVLIQPIEVDALTTVAGSFLGSVSSGTGIAAGQTIVSKNLPLGVTVAAVVAATTVQFGGITTTQVGGATTSQIITGTDAAAYFTGAGVTVDASVQLERSFDGGVTWNVVDTDKAGAVPALYVLGSGHITGAVNVSFTEPEKNVAYRLNVIAYNSGTINYRISISGQAAQTWAPGSV